MDPGGAVDQGLNYMSWSTATDPGNTDINGLIGPTALMSRYVQNAGTWKCPSDNYVSPGQLGAGISARTRSYSLDGALGSGGSGPTVTAGTYLGRTYFGSGKDAQKITELVVCGPASTFAFIDEHADSVNDAVFMFDVVASRASEAVSGTGEYWRDLPASYHGNCGEFSFADGHSEIRKWLETGGNTPPTRARITIFPVIFAALPDSRHGSSAPFSASRDWEWMADHAAYH